MSSPRQRADHFLYDEQQFHLGMLPTEQPHPKTSRFGQTMRRDTVAGLRTLLGVDEDIPPAAERAFQGPAYAALVRAQIQALRQSKRIFISGCGAPGRLAVILETMWRLFWRQAAALDPARGAAALDMAERVTSLITGGDLALIRSVEHFEDYQAFGRRQVREAGLGPGDVLVGMAADGVVSSVIGTAKEAADRGAQVWFVFNNPTGVLVRHLERARELIEDDRVAKLELTTGPMALTGSTRMQATSIAMLVLGAALEETLAALLAAEEPQSHAWLRATLSRADFAAAFRRLVSQFASEGTLASLARWVDLEHETYAQQGRVTYAAGRYLLDILSDTTERTPTFMLPPFHPYDDAQAQEPWAFARDPVRPSPEAWNHLLGRLPRGLDWTARDYAEMNAEREIAQNPPRIGREQIEKYRIGNEDDPARYRVSPAVLLGIGMGQEDETGLSDYVRQNRGKYTRALWVSLGAGASTPPDLETIPIALELPPTRLRLFEHLAVKLALNTISTGAMGKLGRIYGNWMIQVDGTNKKLIDRSIRLVADLAHLSYAEACYEYFRTAEEPQPPRSEARDSYVVQTLRRLGVDLSG